MVEESILIARGKMATLQHEKRKHMTKAQNAARDLMSYLSAALRSDENGYAPKLQSDPVAMAQEFHEQLTLAAELESQIQEIKPIAWPSLIPK